MQNIEDVSISYKFDEFNLVELSIRENKAICENKDMDVINNYLKQSYTIMRSVVESYTSTNIPIDNDSRLMKLLTHSIEDNLKMKHVLDKSRIKNKYKSKISELQSEIEKLSAYKNIDEIVNEGMQPISKLVNTGDNSVLGDSGESLVYDFIRDKLSVCDGSIERVNGKSHCGDMHLRCGQLSTCVEIKNHSKPIGPINVNRFMDIDIDREEYNSGLFISIRSTYTGSTGVDNFSIRIVNEKPLIFLSEVINNMDSICIAIRILQFLVERRSMSNVCISEYVKVIERQISSIKSLKQQMTVLKKSTLEINTIVKEMETELLSILDGEKK